MVAVDDIGGGKLEQDLRRGTLVLAVLSLSLLYRYGASRPGARWRWITLGSVSAALTWFAVSAGFSWYVAHFGQFDRIYGSLGAVIGFMVWLWISLITILLGAELDAEIERLLPRREDL